MFLSPVERVVDFLKPHINLFANGCEKVYVSCSGGVDSTVVVTLLCDVFEAKNVVAMYRDINSNPKHLEDVKKLQDVLGFRLIYIDGNDEYQSFLQKCQKSFQEVGLPWYEENSADANKYGWDSAYASLKSRYTTPWAGFISKAIDNGKGRIFGTGNAEEDVFLRYFDKFGDGAVDNNILCGLTKMEVRQIALYFAEKYNAEIFKTIALKTPSADLLSKGDDHNDESELSSWAKAMGYDIEVSYGGTSSEGNIAWALKENFDKGIISGDLKDADLDILKVQFSYSDHELKLLAFFRQIESSTRHKELGIPGVDRSVLRANYLVD